MANPSDRLSAALADRYRLQRELGRGGMATVYLAEDRKHQRHVAVKVLRPELAAVLGAERFVQEITTTANLHHPHILPVYDSGEAEGFLYYVMPYVEGESLRDRLVRQGELPLTEAVRILRDVADALAAAHAKGVVHRDIKPENIMLSGRHALVADFGVAKAVSGATGRQALTTAGVALGTPTYMAPEQAAADPNTDHRADLYAFGVTAYEMVTGQPPFVGATPQAVLAAHLTEAPVEVSQRRTTTPPPLAELIMRCLAKKPADRPQHAEDLLSILEALRTPSGGTTPVQTQPVTSTRAVPRTRMPTLALAGVAVVVLAVVGLALSRFAGERPSELPADPNVVAVLPFRVAGADPSLQYLGEGMLDLLAAKLTGAGGARAADVRSVLAALRGEQESEGGDVPLEAAERAARRVGAGRIVQGSIVGTPNHLVLNASLITLNGGAARQASVEGPQDSLFLLVDRLTAQLLALGADVSEQQLRSLTTTSLAALRAYLDGVSAYRRGEFGDAGRLLWQAVQIDSSFALATSMLLEALGWAADPPDVDSARVRRLAWQNRDRLTGKERVLLDYRLGARYTPSHVSIADAEQAARVVPESPIAWFNLGDDYFHAGAVADVPDARERAAAAFERALERDSLFAPALIHLAGIRLEQGDTTAFARLAPRFTALDSGAVGLLPPSALVMALARGDHGAARSAIEHLRTLSFSDWEATVINWLPTAAGLAWVDTVFAIMRDRASTSDELADYFGLRYDFERGRGHLRRAGALLDSLAAENPGRAAYKGAVYWWCCGDTALAERFAAQPSGNSGTDRWLRIATGDATAGDEMLDSLRAVDNPSASDSALSLLIRANMAYAQRDPNALALLEAADSSFRGWKPAGRYAPWITRLYVRLGRPEQALRAMQREWWDNFPYPNGLAERRLIRGRLAEQVGDRAAALAAYRDYLAWRSDPDPELVPQRDSVRAAVARLERGG